VVNTASNAVKLASNVATTASEISSLFGGGSGSLFGVGGAIRRSGRSVPGLGLQ